MCHFLLNFQDNSGESFFVSACVEHKFLSASNISSVSKPLQKISLVLLLLGFLVGINLFSTPTNQTAVMKFHSNCQSTCGALASDFSNLSKKYSFEFKLITSELRRHSDVAPFGKETFHISSKSEMSKILKIPIFNGVANDFLELPISVVQRNNIFEILVEQSQLIRIYQNDKLILTTRYQYPVFTFGQISYENDNLNSADLTISEDTPNKFRYASQVIVWFIFGLLLVYTILPKKWNSKLEYNFIDRRTIALLYLISSTLLIIHTIIWLRLYGNQVNVVNGPTNSPFVPSGPRFSDHFQMLVYSITNKPYDSIDINYPPGSLIFYRILSLLSFDYSIFFIFGASVALIFFSFYSTTKSFLFSISSALSFPVVFAFDRGNIDMLCISCLIAMFSLYRSHKKTMFILLGILGSVKIWPLLFLPLLWKIHKSNKMFSTFMTSVVFILLTLGAQATYGGSVLSALPRFGVASGLQIFEFSTALRSAISLTFNYFNDKTFEGALLWYNSRVVTAIILCVGIYLLIQFFRKNSEFEIALYATSIIILLPSITYLYRTGLFLICLQYAFKDISVPQSLRKTRILFLYTMVQPWHLIAYKNTNLGWEVVLIPFMTLACLLILPRSNFVIFKRNVSQNKNKYSV